MELRHGLGRAASVISIITLSVSAAAAADRPTDFSVPGPTALADTIFYDGFDVTPWPGQTDQRFSLLWESGGTIHRAAIRGDASVRDTDDAGLTVVHAGVGHYCIHVSDPAEGTVGVLQDEGGAPGLIDVTMGIGNPCPYILDAQIAVRTWHIP